MSKNAPQSASKTKLRTSIVVIVLLFAVCGLLAGLYIVFLKKDTPAVTAPSPTAEIQSPPSATIKQDPQPAATTPASPTASPPKQQWPVLISSADASSVTVVVNKKHQLPSSYVPASLVAFGSGRLRQDTATALTKMFEDAQIQGHSLKMISGYRSYSDQSRIYSNYVARDGQAAADTYSARPGFSEHQTGLGTDVGTGTCDLEICFGDTSAGKWIALNAQNYGFIVRYPKGKEAATGYQYEPWHLRYLGIDTAKAVYGSGKTLDQYYNVPAGGYE